MNNLKFIVFMVSVTIIIIFALSSHSKYSDFNAALNPKDGIILNVKTNAPSDQR